MQTAATERKGDGDSGVVLAGSETPCASERLDPEAERASLDRWFFDVCMARDNAVRFARDLHTRHEQAKILMRSAGEDLRLGKVEAAKSTLVLIEQILAGVA